MMVYNGKERVREECGKGGRRKRGKRKPVWADMMKHSYFVGKKPK